MGSSTPAGVRADPARWGPGAGHLALGVALAALAGLAVAKGAVFFVVAGFGAAALLVGGFAKPGLFLLGVLALRPLLDATTERTLSLGGLGINAAGVVGALIASVALAVVLTRRRTSATPIAAAGALIVGVSLVAAGHTVFRYGALLGTEPVEEIVRLISLGGIYLLALHLVDSADRLRRVAVVVTLSATVPALYGLYQWASGVAPVASDLDLGRLNATFSGPNAAGMYFAVVALLLIGLPDRLLSRPVRYGSMILTVGALLGTYSRTGWLLFLIGVFALLWRDHKRALVAAGASMILVVTLVGPVRERLFDTQAGYTVVSGQLQKGHLLPSSYTWRLTTWEGLLRTYAKRPALGYGLRTTAYVNPRNPTRVAGAEPRGEVGATAEGLPAVGYDPHNTVIKLLVEGGPLLLAAYALLLVALLKTCRRLSRCADPVGSIGRTLWIVWAAIAIVAVAADDPPVATATVMALLALTGACEGAARSR